MQVATMLSTKQSIVQPHSAFDYDRLCDIDSDGVATLTVEDEQCLDAMGDVITAFNWHETLGVALLHSHFRVLSGEVMVESPLPGRRLLTRPERIADFYESQLHPIAVKIEPREAGVALIGLEYGAYGGCDRTFGDAAFISSLNAVLSRFDRHNRFGIGKIRNPLLVSDEDILLEVTNKHRRELVCEVVSAADGRVRSSTETFWTFAPCSESADPTRICNRTCQRTCNRRCGRRCNRRCWSTPYGHQNQGHDTQHDYGHDFGHTPGHQAETRWH
ncbi:MAG: hypothetical protein U1A77_25590 [Pirellulales bacterium]